MSQADNDYENELQQMDDPWDDDSNIDSAVSAKLLTVSKTEEETWLAESITEQDAEMVMVNLRAFLDGRDTETAMELADALAIQLADYMRPTIQNDYEELMGGEKDDTAERESHIIDMQEVAALRHAA